MNEKDLDEKLDALLEGLLVYTDELLARHASDRPTAAPPPENA